MGHKPPEVTTPQGRWLALFFLQGLQDLEALFSHVQLLHPSF